MRTLALAPVAMAAVLSLPLAAQADETQADAPRTEGQCGAVSIAQMGWAAAEVTTNIAKFFLEQGYGCDVSLVQSDTVPAITSVAENGSPDVVTNLWLNSAGDAYKKLEEGGTIERVASVLTPGGVEGWWIPTKLAEEHPELKTIQGVLDHPEWVGNRFNNCPDGWGCRVVSDNLARALDLEGHGIKVFNHGSGETLSSSMGAAVTDDTPWFGYYWGPTVPMGKYDMTRVSLGDYDKAAFDKLQNKDTPDPKVSEFPAAPILTSVTTAFAKSHPAETDFFRHMTFKTATMSGLLAWQDENNASAEETAVHFITSNPDVWADWLDDDAKAKLSKLMQ
ncbi:glycine/betaine ABC transporter substrate-binding protein [Pseudooceanicola sp. CBS1P-1]|uniref:Glycine/betaine ABC transporter substrate-binding protein n=1 Tax=Pseudooceanicola albus TaxID=2692189 RepID=A0A6L7G7D9_9RHOB|nr:MULTISPECIES: glycine betaine ABC transporter substrate-binding protein [Pseudooceanicola]MBT9385997.1 glycine/betaine ABC transporter substrate-binding protein [Pseudooceanicola endophyticus]MXN19582.1 glycine/betaine ABC transporter substrate-binding protein [Pseudooceanicola albus]